MAKLRKLTHIAFAVKSIDGALPVFQNLLAATVLLQPFTPSDRQHRVIILSVAGIVIELMEPIDENGFLARFLAKKGEGFNHIGFDVEDIKGASEVLRSKGIEIFRERVNYSGLKYAFIHPKTFFGIESHLEEDWMTLDDLETV